MAGDKAPLTKALTADAPAVATAGNDASESVGPAPFAGTVAGVTYTPSAAITGANTNSRTLKLVNKGQSGSGTTVIAELALTSGVNAAAFDEKALTLSGTAANKEVAEGDVLAFVSEHVGTGITDPGGEVQVRLERS
jgi:hypothetical protein